MFKQLLFTICISLLFALSGQTQTIDQSLEHDGINRSYRVHIPTGYQDGDELPLVFNFHGFSSNAVEQEIYSQMSSVADEENFFVVYPQGTGLAQSWNVGWNFGSDEDDVGFTSAMIDALYGMYQIDTSRVYACGMSNGGFFSYQLACQLNDRIAKIASVTGSMLASELEACELSNPIPVMQIHGTDDEVVNYGGTPNVSVGIETLLSTWRELNGCTEISDTIAIPNEVSLDFSTAELIQHRDCEGEAYMAFYKIDNGGHTWPGALLNIGVTNQDFNASKEIWDFFNDQYPKDEVVATVSPEFNQSFKLSVFPNPSSDFFQIRSDNHDISKILVFNALGQLVQSINGINNRNYRLESSTLKKGIYFAQIHFGNASKTVRLVKQ